MADEDFYIPLTQSIFNIYPNLYIYLTVMRNQTVKHFFNFSKHSLYSYHQINTDYHISRAACGMHRNNFNKAAKEIPLEQRFSDESICLMPIQVWDKWENWVERFIMRARNSWTRVFCYVYFNADKWDNNYTNSVDNIAAELQMDSNDVSKKLIMLQQAGWISRSFYLVNTSARTYSINEPWLSYSMRLKKAQSM